MYFYIEIMACAFFFIIDSFFLMGIMNWRSNEYDESGHSKVLMILMMNTPAQIQESLLFRP